jgi:hypothetical protein
MTDDKMEFNPGTKSGPSEAAASSGSSRGRISSDVIVKSFLITFILILICAIAIVAMKKSGVFDAMVPQYADTEHPQNLTGKWWSVEYPGDWALKTDADGSPQDRYVMIESANDGAYVKLELIDSDKHARIVLSQKVKEYKKTGKNFRAPDTGRAFFAKWGNMSGVGSRFQITLGDVEYEGRVFVYYIGEGRMFFAHQMVSIDRAPNLVSAFELIQESFKLTATASGAEDEDGSASADEGAGEANNNE